MAYVALCMVALACAQACAAESTDVSQAQASPGNDPCMLPEGAAPTRIADVVTMVNALPRPLDLPCFVRALARPLHMQAVHSIFSAQPSNGLRSPRVFIFNEPLTMTVVPEGIGRNLLELGELQSDHALSIKAELHFPIEDTVEPERAFTSIEAPGGGGTRCAACHRAESRAAPGMPVYVSAAYRSRDSDPDISVESLHQEAKRCDPIAEPERCALLSALFAGPVEEARFPSGMTTCFAD